MSWTKIWIGVCLIGLMSVSDLMAQKLDYWVTRDYQYMLRQSIDSLALVRSANPALEPWMPERQFGWQFLDAPSFHRCFEPAVIHPLAIDFDQEIVLTIIRNDPYIWDIQVSSVEVDVSQAVIYISYSLNQLGEKLSRPQLQNVVVGIMPHDKMKKLGTRNWTFKLEEERLDVPPDLPYLDTEETLMFPPFFGLKELNEALPLLRKSW